MGEESIEEELEISLGQEAWQCSKCDFDNGCNDCLIQDAVMCIQGFYRRNGEWVDD